MEAIETIFENYKAGYNEETPYTQEQQKCFDVFSDVIEKVFADNDTKIYFEQQSIFEKAVAYARASEKSGFILGFKMAMNIMQELNNILAGSSISLLLTSGEGLALEEKKVYLEVPEFTGENVPVTVAARVMKKDPQFVRQGIILGFLTFGVAFKKDGSSQYDYYISPIKFWQETGYIYRGEGLDG